MKTARFLVFFAGVLLASSAIGQMPTVLDISAPGRYIATVGADGQLTVVGPVATISPGGVVPVPVPPVPPPPPAPDDDRAKEVADLIKALPISDARHQNAIKFAGTLGLIADQLTKGTLPQGAISSVYGPLMAYAVPDANWEHIKKAVLDGIGTCPSPAVCATALQQYAAGAMSTVPNKADPQIVRGADGDEIAAAAEDYGFDWSALLKLLLPLLLALLQQWIG